MFAVEPIDYKLADLLSIAGATIGIIIAAGVILQMLSTKYTAIFERYRGLAGEYRSNHFSDPRRDSLKNQLSTYRRQIIYLNYSSLCVSLAVITFLVTVGVAGASVMFPQVMALRTVGTVALFAGLALIAVGIGLQVLELIVQRHSIGEEVSDFPDLPSVAEALRK